MANTINVTVRKPNTLRVQVQAPTAINASLRKIFTENSKLEELLNVDELAYGLYDGFTVVYDALTQTWKTTHVRTVLNEAVNLDGGEF